MNVQWSRLLRAVRRLRWRSRWAAVVVLTILLAAVGLARLGSWLVNHPRWLLVLAGFVGTVFLLGCVFVLPRHFAPTRPASSLEGLEAEERLKLEDERLKLQNDIRMAMLQAIGGAAVLVGVFLTWQQLQGDREQAQTDREQAAADRDVTRQGQVAERFTRSIDQLSSEKFEVTIGGIYGLEQIAKQQFLDLKQQSLDAKQQPLGGWCFSRACEFAG
jgi:hypothetical protein